MHIWQTFNALFIVRCIVKYLIETGTEYQLLQHFEAMPSVSATDDRATNTSEQTNGAVAVNIETEQKTKLVRSIDGSKFETFFDAIVNILIIIPVK